MILFFNIDAVFKLEKDMQRPYVLGDVCPTPGSSVILTSANFAYKDIVENWLNWIKKLELENTILVVCEDIPCYSHFKDDNKAVTLLTTFNRSIEEAQMFRSSNFNFLVNRRIAYVLQLLEQGTNVLYTDADTVVFENPFPFFSKDYDLQIQSEEIKLNSGMFFIRSTPASLEVMRLWKNLSGEIGVNQPMFNKAIKLSPDLRVRELPREQFLGTEAYCMSNISWYERDPTPVIFHATFIRGPIEKKKLLSQWDMWSLSSN